MIQWSNLKFPPINLYNVWSSTYMTETQPKVTTMLVTNDDLQRLITDLKGGTLKMINDLHNGQTLYHGDANLVLIDCLEELQHFRNEGDSDVPVIKPETALDVQIGGDHYKTAIQPVQYIHANEIGFCEGNVIKYVSRWRNKNGIADLDKAKHYIELLIQLELDKGDADEPDQT